MFAFSSGCMKYNEEKSNLFFLRTQMAVRVIERTKDEFRQIRTNPSRSIHDSYNIFPPCTSRRIPNRSPTDRNRDSWPRFPNIPHTATVYTHVETEFKRSIWSVIRDQRLVIVDSRRPPLKKDVEIIATRYATTRRLLKFVSTDPPPNRPLDNDSRKRRIV